MRPAGGAQGPGERLPQLPDPQRPLPLAVVQEQAWGKTVVHPDRCGPRQAQDDSPSNLRLGQAEGAGIPPGAEPCPVRHRLQEGGEVVRLHRRQEEEGQGPRERRRRPGSRCRLGYHPSGDGERRHHPREEPEAGAIEVAGEARPEGPRQESERGQEPPQSPPQAPEDMVPDYKHQG